MLKALVLVAAALAVAVSGQQNGVELMIFPDGTYYVLMNGQQWFTSGAYSLVIGGKTYSSRDGSLQLTATTTRTGADPFLGAFNATAFAWTATDAAATPYVTTIYEYAYASPASDVTYVFEQSFPAAVATGATADASDTDVVSAFPSFIPAVAAGGPAVNYLTYHDTFAYCHIGHWKTPAFPGGNEGGSPLLWFDDKLNSLILSPLTHFMVGAQTLSASNQNDLSCGFTAKVQNIPAGTIHQTVLYADTGINDALYRWGDILLNTHTYNGGPAKTRTALDADFALKWLGWWTDNGGAYWYMTENNTDYQQTMLDAKAYNEQIGLPAKYFQLDSWWYPKDQINGVTLWEPMPQVFPSGMSQWLGLPLELHNRWFSPENEYITSGNFTSSFIVEEIAALPVKPDVFTHLMGKAKAWGMFTYEQDWLSFVYRQMQAVRNNIDNGAKWLHSMGDAAAGLDLTVQYCMPLPCHTLQSTKIQPVTQIRSSDDYRPGRTYPPNWEVAHTNMLIWAVGAVPFKDDFWSTTAVQWDCPYANATGCQEPNPRLEVIISAVTAGPIAPSDRIGSTVPALIMETCRSDGLLLKPDRPATYLDSTFALTFDTLADVKAWHTYSDLGNGCIVHYLLVMDIAQPYVIRPADLGIFASRSFVYEYNSSSKVLPASVMELDAANTITVPAAPHPGSNTPRYYRYYVITPILQNGWVFLGEPDKMIPASATRFSNVGVSPQKFTATVTGAPGEVVNTAFIANPDIAPPGTAKQPVTYVYNIPCTIPASGQATASCGGDTCRCG